MASPIIFSGSYAKLLTPKGILNSDGSINQYDGDKNYINYAQFEQGLTTGWSLFNTTLTSGLPTGSIGSGAASLTLNTTPTNPIDGSYSLQVVAGTSWTAGQGYISDEITIDRGDYGKVLSFSFYYEGVSGATNANWSGVLGSQSLAVYIYDATALQWVQPAGFLGMNQSSGVGMVTGTFQTSVTAGQKYRIAVIALQAIANPITVNFDRFNLSPNQVVLGTPVTDWKSYTPTVTYASGAATNVSHYGRYRRVGDSIEIEVSSVWSSASAAFTRPIYSLPSGLTVDTSKNTASVQGAITDEVVGFSRAQDTVNNAYPGSAALYSTTQFFPHLINASTTYGSFQDFTSTIPFSVGANDSITTIVRLPIVGWSSNVQTSSDTDTRVVAARYNLSVDQSIPNNSATTVIWNNKNFDSHAGMNTSTGIYTIPVSGYYTFKIGQRWASNATGIRYVSTLITGTSSSLGTTYNVFNTNTDFVNNSASDTLYFNAGDTIAIQAFQSSGVALAFKATSAYFEIERLSGPSVITATETVACRYTNASGQSIPNNATTAITGWTKDFDTHNFFSSSGVGTIPVSGSYFINLGIIFGSASVVAGTRYGILISRTGLSSSDIWLAGAFPNASSTTYVHINGGTIVKFNAGDTITVKAYQTSGGARLLDVDSATNHVEIVRVGN